MNLSDLAHNKVLQVAAIIAALGTITATGRVLWNDFGWITPVAYAEDLDGVLEAQAAIESTILSEIRKNQDEWKCDEYDEELADLLLAQSEGDETIETAERIQRIRALRARRDCARFDE